MNKLPTLVLISLIFFTTIVHTEPLDHRFSIGWSQWGLDDDFNVGTIKLAYEFGKFENIWGIRAVVSSFVNDDFDDFYISAGFLKEFTINPKWSWGFGGEGGYYSADALGKEIEFYSRALVNYHLSESAFLRAEIGHISNASFGDVNPGSENLAITYNWQF
jgi:hypothetical protein